MSAGKLGVGHTVFFSLRLKNSRAQKLKLKPKNSNSRIFSRKLKHFFSKKLKKPENFESSFAFYHKSMQFMYQILHKNPNYLDIAVKTQRIFENSRPKQPKFFQKLKISETPLSNAAQKTAKKKPWCSGYLSCYMQKYYTTQLLLRWGVVQFFMELVTTIPAYLVVSD